MNNETTGPRCFVKTSLSLSHKLLICQCNRCGHIRRAVVSCFATVRLTAGLLSQSVLEEDTDRTLLSAT